MLDIIKYSTINRYKIYIQFDTNSNSRLYFDKDLIHKIPYNPKNDLENLLYYINKLSLNELVEIRNLIYDNQRLVGYSMKNYKAYRSLRKFKYRDFDLKKKDCITIIRSFDVISKHNLSYSDFHLGNILLNPDNNDIKICDIDGFNILDDQIKKTKKLKYVLGLILSYLYSVNTSDIMNVLNSNGVNGDSLINECCIGNSDKTLDELFCIVNEFKYSYVKKERQLIIDKSKELSNMGYSKYCR